MNASVESTESTFDGILLKLRGVTRLLYRFRGLARLAEAIRRYFATSGREITIHNFDGTLTFRCSLNDHMASQIFWRGYYSDDQLALLRRQIRADSVFMDVGANQGEFTLFAAKRLAKGRVIAFEPSRYLFARLEQNVKANRLANVRLINCGLGDRATEAMLYTMEGAYADGTSHSGLPTLYPSPQRNKEYERVKIMALDEFTSGEHIERIDILKIDVEGAELAVLRGAVKTIELSRPTLIIEIAQESCEAAGYSMAELFEYIISLGYTCASIKKGGATKDIVSAADLGPFQNLVCRPAGEAGGPAQTGSHDKQ